MFILVLQQCHKENEDKWKRLSRQIADVILPMIAKQQVCVCVCDKMSDIERCRSSISVMVTKQQNYCARCMKLNVEGLLFPQIHLDSPEALGVLNTLFETVAPSSLRPVDMLLKSMFTTPATMVRTAAKYIVTTNAPSMYFGLL